MKAKDRLLLMPGFIQVILKEAGDIGDRRGFGVFAVGGFVRDLMLNKKSLDIDIAVQGDGIGLAGELAYRLGASLAVFKCFGTAVLEAKTRNSIASSEPLPVRIDIATARREYYKTAACYPEVRPAGIRADLKRRDFTINAMALVLNKRRFAEKIDYFAGTDDLEKGIIRVLHDKSFIDDPTRIFRAIRFEQRYGFNIDNHTLRLMKEAVRDGMICRLNKRRIEKELALFQREGRHSEMAARLEQITGE
ncbi:MAG: hypothetical protein PHV77_02830 [Candidatus Omnitrophica bacterium]|jgi:tRNA nucleotidyltransferase (CCA-adding enzyme)|nr:hypothetical protein [Candidatus Omnitrophota bacterium]